MQKFFNSDLFSGFQLRLYYLLITYAMMSHIVMHRISEHQLIIVWRFFNAEILQTNLMARFACVNNGPLIIRLAY